jgi:two-component system response regulator LytT
MKVLIIEDEPPAQKKLANLISRFNGTTEIVAMLSSVAETIRWFSANPAPDLVFADIELLDGNIFGVFDRVKITCPIIFTTAYDQFTLQAFERNGIAYLLKPFDFEKFSNAFSKYELLKSSFAAAQNDIWRELQKSLMPPKYKERFVIKLKGGIQLLETKTIAFFQMRDEILYAFDARGATFPIQDTISNLESNLNPHQFFRLNRSEIVSLDHIADLKPDFQDRLIVSIRNSNIKLTSSASRTSELRKWLEN